uniref:Uncharacterized protein n=1 Tax=Candidatus Kentrum sp. FW TaxID=2126338 RepID=A0A450RW17_9GAMM|nr:MAG: hypothetical protein BECKFW1821A_GA0114235_100353 [Candidatus Kentron sp. FW]VFJ70010.1 MAG: hypothetical protein BECKFW1821B_GA0114236_11775 [Candidatus Kentron sp. FW]
MFTRSEIHADNDSVKHRYRGHGVFSAGLDLAYRALRVSKKPTVVLVDAAFSAYGLQFPYFPFRKPGEAHRNLVPARRARNEQAIIE